MAITSAEVVNYTRDRIALNYVASFGNEQIAELCDFAYTRTYSSGNLNGLTVTVCPSGSVVTTPRLQDGIMRLPGGRVYSPYSIANVRAPTPHNTFSQRIVYRGDIRAVMHEYENLMVYVGITTTLTFNYGLTGTGAYAPKSCQAMLMPVTFMVERVMRPNEAPAKTWVELTAVWEQIGNFT